MKNTKDSNTPIKKTAEGRNEFLEMDGLFWESETHEWFNDKISTQHARKNSVLWGSGEQKDALNVMCFVVRNKETGENHKGIQM